MSWILSVGVGLLVLPSLLLVLVPLVDYVLNSDFLELVYGVVPYMSVMVGDSAVNFFLVCISIIMFLHIFYWIIRIIRH